MGSELDYLLSLEAVRERASRVFNIAQSNGLNHFDYHPNKLSDAADFVAKVITVSLVS